MTTLFAHLYIQLGALSFRQVLVRFLTFYKYIAVLFQARLHIILLLVVNIDYLNYKYLLGKKFLNPVSSYSLWRENIYRSKPENES